MIIFKNLHTTYTVEDTLEQQIKETMRKLIYHNIVWQHRFNLFLNADNFVNQCFHELMMDIAGQMQSAGNAAKEITANKLGWKLHIDKNYHFISVDAI